MNDETKIDDGGAAFPMPQAETSLGGNLEQYGMSLRDWFAGQALAGVMAGYWSNSQMGGLGPSHFANEAYQVADAMIAERNK